LIRMIRGQVLKYHFLLVTALPLLSADISERVGPLATSEVTELHLTVLLFLTVPLALPTDTSRPDPNFHIPQAGRNAALPKSRSIRLLDLL
jgi:hypothetical protein